MSGFGTDVWCADSLCPGRYARGTTLLGQALYRRLITPRGMLRGGDEESTYGLDLSAYVGSLGYTYAAAALPGLIRGELLKDDRVRSVRVATVQSTSSAGLISLDLTVRVTPADETGAFSFTVQASAMGVELLGGIA